MTFWRMVVVLNSPVYPSPGTNTWHAQTPLPASDDDNQGLLLDLENNLAAFYVALDEYMAGSSAAVFDGVWTEIPGEDGFVRHTAGWNAGAASALAPMPPADCLAIQWRAATGGRSGRGRSFLGPLGTSTLQDNGTPTEAFRTDMKAAGDELITAQGDSGDGQFCVWSEKDQTGRPFATCLVPNKFASLRSRRD